MISRSVSEAVRLLTNGGVVAIPTETVYGLGALVHHQQAVMRVFHVKGRPTDHPLIVHLGTTADPTRWGILDDNALRLAASFWPGPLTLLVPRTALVPDWVTGGRDTVALRVPAHPVAQELLNRLDDGLVAPSANLFGHVSPTTAAHVQDDLGETIDMILDGGSCTVGIESTIVECVGNRVQILRPGAITREDVMAVVDIVDTDTTDARAPGMLLSHYAPKARIVLCQSADDAEQQAKLSQQRGIPSAVVNENDVRVYALNLYARLRTADTEGIEVIFAVLPPASGLGAAVRDRLHKAAAGR